MIQIESSFAIGISAVPRQYDSFVLRRWRVGNSEQRPEVEHMQSGGHTRVETMEDALAWIDAIGGSPSTERGDQVTQTADVPEPTEVLYAEGATCATLTPLIRAKIRELESGSVLEICTDDPSARVDIPAWSRLTGNELVSAVEEDAQRTRFYVRKK